MHQKAQIRMTDPFEAMYFAEIQFIHTIFINHSNTCTKAALTTNSLYKR